MTNTILTTKEFPTLLTITLFMIILDIPFLQMTKGHFNSVVKSIQGDDILLNYGSAIITYLIMGFSFYHFIVKNKGKLNDAIILGFVIYGVFDFTNMSIFKNWNLQTALMDTVWGSILYGLTYLSLQTFTKIL